MDSSIQRVTKTCWRRQRARRYRHTVLGTRLIVTSGILNERPNEVKHRHTPCIDLYQTNGVGEHGVDQKAKRHAAGALLLGGVIFVLIGVGGYFTTQRSLSDAGWVTHTQEVIAAIDEIQAGMLSAESSVRGYVLTDDGHFWACMPMRSGACPNASCAWKRWCRTTRRRSTMSCCCGD